MEGRGLVARAGEGGSRSSHRNRTGLTAEGRRTAERAIQVHGGNIRRCFLDPLTQEQATALRAWSEQTIGQFEPGWIAARPA
ncbi:MAG: hypothetical protein JO016_13475 [Actinobacteria bacterium]|nr:hypothetical protein [Actinomycetota bacterium]